MKQNGCSEYQSLSRRTFVGAGTTALLALGVPWIPNIAYANKKAGGGARDVVVCVFLRGGADGLSICAPCGDKLYYTDRPNIAIPPPDSSDPNKGIALDNYFALPAAMAPLSNAFKDGHLAIVQATGSPSGSRSHFDAQKYMEQGKPDDSTLFTGWVGRHLASTAPMVNGAPLRGVAINFGLDLGLAGGPQSLPIPNPGSFMLAGSSKTASERRKALAGGYNEMADPLKTAAANTQKTMDLLGQINFTAYVPQGGAVYPVSNFGNQMKAAAALIKAEAGVEAVYLDLGGWDTHQNEGPVTGGMAQTMANLASALEAFRLDTFGSASSNITVVVMSEFGRNVKENGSRGTDHGHGNVMFVMSPVVKGGKVHGNWPGLAKEQRYQGQDLMVTTDFRDVLSEVVYKRLGNDALGQVFPGYTPKFAGLFA